MEKLKIKYLTCFLSTVILCKVSGCPFEAVPGDPYRYLITAANIKTICAPGTKFSIGACTCVSAPNDPRLKAKQETRSKFPANPDAVVKPKSDLFTSHSAQLPGSNIANRNHIFTSASVSGIGHGTFSGSLSMNNNGHVSNFKFPSNQESRRGGFVSGESFATPSNTDSLFDLPPQNNAGDSQTLLDKPLYPGNKPIHFSKTERQGNQIHHSSFSIHPGAGSSSLSMRTHLSGRHSNNRQSGQSPFSFTDPQAQDFFNWPLPPQRNDGLGFDLFHSSTNGQSPFDNLPHGNSIHSGVLPPPNGGRSPLGMPPPPPPPPKSIEHRLYLENENLSPSHMDRLRPKPVQVNKSTRRKVSQQTLDTIRSWFTGGHFSTDEQYTDRFLHGNDATGNNGGKPIDTRHPPRKTSNTDALFNLPDGRSGSQDQFGNTDSLFNLPDNGAGTRGQIDRNTDSLFNFPDNGAGLGGKRIAGNTDNLFNGPNTGSGPIDLPGNTDDLFNLPTGGSIPRDLQGNRDQSFGLSSVSDVSGGFHNVSPKNKVPVNPMDLNEVPFLEIPPSSSKTSKNNGIPANTDDLFNLPPVNDVNPQKDNFQNNNPLPPIGSHLTGLSRVSQFLDLGNGQDQSKHIPDSKINRKIPTMNLDHSFSGQQNPAKTTTDFPPFVFDPAGESFGFDEVHAVGEAKTGTKTPPGKNLPPIGSHLTGLSRVSQFLDLGNGQNANKPIPDSEINSKIPATNLDNSFSDQQHHAGNTPPGVPSFVFDPAGESFGLNEVHAVGETKSGSKKPASKIPALRPGKTNINQVVGKFNDGFLDVSIFPAKMIGGNFNKGHGTGNVGLNIDRSGAGHGNPKEFIPIESLTRKTNDNDLSGGPVRSGNGENLDLNGHIPDRFVNPNEFVPLDGFNGQVDSGNGHPLEPNGHLPRHVNPNEFLPVNNVIGPLDGFNGQVNPGSGHPLEPNGHLSGHVNPNEFLPVNGFKGPSNDEHSVQNGGGNFGNFNNDDDVINLLNEVDIETLLEAIGGIPLHEIDTQALRMFQKKVNQLIQAPKEEPTLKNLIKNQKLISAPVRSEDKTIESGKPKKSLTLSPQELNELQQKLQQEIDRITRQEAAEKEKAESLANQKANRKAQRQAREQVKKERQQERKLARQQAKAERMTRQEKAKLERKAKQERARLERKARQQKQKQERQARKEIARQEKKARQEEKRRQRQEQRQRQNRMKADA